MAVWIFQGKPGVYDIAKKLVPGDTARWLVSHYQKQISKGDIVLFWRAGDRDERGLYGWGRVVDDAPSFNESEGWRVGVVYEEKFGKFVSVGELEDRALLDDNRILTMPIGTTFGLSSDESEAVCEFIKEKNERAPDCGGLDQ